MVDEKNFYGWICPKCGAALAPWLRVCPNCAEGGLHSLKGNNTEILPDENEAKAVNILDEWLNGKKREN